MKVKIIWDTLADGLDKQINEFMKEHDVIKVEHFGDLDEVTTIITYREDKK